MRRLAILDDNQLVLEERIAALRLELPSLLGERGLAAMIIGSVAAGSARDESDIDVVVVLRHDTPRRSDYAWWDLEIAPKLPGDGRGRFPVQPVIIGAASLATQEPNLRHALREGIVLWDPEGVLGDQSEARA